MFRYTRSGWPRCCGCEMAFLTESATLDSDGEDADADAA
jgi:hypothetical protein